MSSATWKGGTFGSTEGKVCRRGLFWMKGESFQHINGLDYVNAC